MSAVMMDQTASNTGRFIVFEGGEGGQVHPGAASGRGARRARDRGRAHARAGRHPGAEAIRSLLLSTQGEGWGARAEALLFAAARADHVERLIRPALARGAWVICDRYIDSSRAYQGGGNGLSDADVLTLHRIGSEGLLPDCTILLEVDPQEAATRCALRDQGVTDRIGGRDPAYHARVGEAFAAFAAAEPERFARIPAQGSPQAVSARIMAVLDRWLDRGNA
jgi:dTMP kinase